MRIYTPVQGPEDILLVPMYVNIAAGGANANTLSTEFIGGCRVLGASSSAGIG
jgi:hypothetical protein